MSVVTDVVFVAFYRPDADRFAALVSEHYWNGEHTPRPQEDDGPKVPGATVFNFGFNYASDELIAALRAEKWESHTVLWIDQEAHDGPEIWVDGKLARDAPIELY